MKETERPEEDHSLTDTFYTAEQVAEKLQIHWATVTKAIRDGKLEAIQIGKTYRISESALKAYIESLKVEAKGADTECEN